MRVFVFALLSCLALQSFANPVETVLVSKKVMLRMYFDSATPFYMQNEHGGSCYELVMPFSYAYDENSHMQFYPILNAPHEFTNECADMDDWDANNALVQALNQRVQKSNYGSFSLLVETRYQLKKIESDDYVEISEEMSFDLPDAPKPFQYRQHQRVQKPTQMPVEKSCLEKTQDYLVELLKKKGIEDVQGCLQCYSRC